MNKLLLEILACPNCKGSVCYDEPKQNLICLNCRLSYPIHDDIPIMLLEKAHKIDTNAKS